MLFKKDELIEFWQSKFKVTVASHLLCSSDQDILVTSSEDFFNLVKASIWDLRIN